MRLIQIVPRLRPFDGVSDYALLLARRLRDDHGVDSTFVAAAGPPSPATGFAAHVMASATPDACDNALAAAGCGQGAHVLLHYVGYGYAPRGAPLWLSRAVARARPAFGFRLGVAFHELYATGRSWNSSFWLSGVQRWIARRLAVSCDWALVTREASRQWLEARGGLAGKPVSVVPMCSTVGEPPAPPAASTRPAVLVVWGGRATKDAVYGEQWPLVREACRSLGITRIVDIGPAASRYPEDGPAVDVRGMLDAPDLSRELLAARFGLLRYPASFLAKSTIYAAYCAHGVIPLLDDDAMAPSLDGIEARRHFLPVADAAGAYADPGAGNEIAANAYSAYRQHDSARHAQRIRAMLDGALR